MSDLVLPVLPGRKFLELDPFTKTEIFESPGGTEQRVSLMPSPKRRWRIFQPSLRDYEAAPAPWNPYSELGALLFFRDHHKGPGDSFLFDDPMSRTNLLAYSQEMNQAAWVKNTGVSIVADSVAAPDGTMTADSVVYDGTGVADAYRILQTALAPSESAVVYTTSVWLRAASSFSVRIGQNFANQPACALTTAWQRFSVTDTGDGTTNVMPRILSASGDNVAWTIYAWGMQAERGSSARLYVPTGATAANGRYRVRFERDSFVIRKIASQVYEASFELVTTPT